MKLSVIAVFLSLLVTTVFATRPLKFSIVIHRHGDRTPTYLYPSDPYTESFWKKGLGQLTNLGKNQMYSLGKFIRYRYRSFLPVIYNEKDIQVISSDVSRVLMSAYTSLAGLYPPQHEDVWSLGINWQPIPVHIIPTPQDNILHNFINCTKHKMLTQNYSTKNKEKVEKYYKIMQEVIPYTGRKIDSVNYMDYVHLAISIHDSLFVEEIYNLKLPKWTVNYYPEPLREIALFAFSVPSATKELCRLRSGPLLKEILTLFDGVQQGTLKKKMYLFSGHDNTILDLLQCLGVYDYQLIPYASAVFLELYDGNNVPEILVGYKKGDVGLMKELKIPGCNNMVRCPLDSFKKLIKDLIPDDWEKECDSV